MTTEKEDDIPVANIIEEFDYDDAMDKIIKNDIYRKSIINIYRMKKMYMNYQDIMVNLTISGKPLFEFIHRYFGEYLSLEHLPEDNIHEINNCYICQTFDRIACKEYGHK